jgi:hypothetical protein
MKNEAPRMSALQMNHALNRLSEISNEKAEAIKARLKGPARELTGKQFVTGVKNGSIKLRRDAASRLVVSDNHYRGTLNYLTEVFDLKAYTSSDDNKKVEAALKPLRAEMSVLKDKLILGDSSDALKLIEAFAAKKF